MWLGPNKISEDLKFYPLYMYDLSTKDNLTPGMFYLKLENLQQVGMIYNYDVHVPIILS